MMKKSTLKITLSLLISCLLIGAQAFGQDYSFMVLGAKGGITVDGKAVKVGSTLKEGQEIKTEAGSYLGLAHISGKTLEIKKKGDFKVADLQKKITSGSNSLANQYASFVISELTGGDQVQNRYAQRAKTGSVTRGLKAINFYLPEKVEVYGSKAMIRWFIKSDQVDASEISSYKYKIKDVYQQVIQEGETSEAYLEVDLNDPKFKDKKRLMYSVEAGSSLESPDQMLVLVQGQKKNEIKSELSKVSNDNTVFSKIAEAQVYEEKELYANAINSYEEALKIDDAEQFKSLYKAFLMRNKLSPEALEMEK